MGDTAGLHSTFIEACRFVTNVEAHVNVHTSSSSSGIHLPQYKLAIESYKKAIQADPTNAIYPANMAAAFMQLRDYDNAEKCKKVIEIDPKYGP